MFKRVLIRELKSIPRDRMYLFLVFYPFMMIGISLLLIPYLRSLNQDLASQIVILVFILLMGFMYGAITGFTLLDDQDDNVLLSLRITPISVRHYVLIKLLICYLMSILFTFLLIVSTNVLPSISLTRFLMILILAPMQGPLIAVLINCFATNKVEGFVYMKLSGLLLMIPIASLFLTNWTELGLGWIPGFWSARIISMELLPLDYFLGYDWVYFLVGLITHVVIFGLLFKLYMKRIIT